MGQIRQNKGIMDSDVSSGVSGVMCDINNTIIINNINYYLLCAVMCIMMNNI